MANMSKLLVLTLNEQEEEAIDKIISAISFLKLLHKLT